METNHPFTELAKTEKHKFKPQAFNKCSKANAFRVASKSIRSTLRKVAAMLLLLLLPSQAVLAYDFMSDGIYYDITSATDLTCEVTYRNNYNYTGNIVIPESVTYNGTTYSVTSIGDYAFCHCN